MEPGAKVCVACKADIADEYYLAGGQVLCARCRAGLTRAPQGSGVGAFFKALALGLLGAVVAAGLWAAVAMITGYEIGLIAIVVGLIVGFAVRKGASGHSGLRFQLLAIALTFCGLSWATIPFVIKELVDRPKEEAPPPPVAEPSEPGAGEVGIAVGVLLLMLLILPFVAYVGGLAQSPISILFLGIALYEAWRINQRRHVEVSGPFPASGRIDFSKP